MSSTPTTSRTCGGFVSVELARKHQRYACSQYLDSSARLGLPIDRIPQLDEVTALLEALTGFR